MSELRKAEIKQLTRRVEPEVVEFLANALERARAGEVSGILLLAQDSTGVQYSVAGLKDRYHITGWLMHAIHKLQSDT